MKILILGVGKVGGTLAEHLAGEAFDVTVVDLDEQRPQLRVRHIGLLDLAGLARRLGELGAVQDFRRKLVQYGRCKLKLPIYFLGNLENIGKCVETNEN